MTYFTPLSVQCWWTSPDVSWQCTASRLPRRPRSATDGSFQSPLQYEPDYFFLIKEHSLKFTPKVYCFPQMPDNFRTNKRTASKEKSVSPQKLIQLLGLLSCWQEFEEFSDVWGKWDERQYPALKAFQSKMHCATLIFQVNNERYLKPIVPPTERKTTVLMLTHVPLSPKQMPILYKMPLSPWPNEVSDRDTND